jgi:hypothetical protein
MQTIKVRLSAVRRAVTQAHQAHGDWQAEHLEILLLPQVYRRWQEVNRPHFSEPTITRHPGFRWTDGREAAAQVTDWSIYAGYTFTYGPTNWRWNSVTTDWYGHAPSVTWDGVRRETYHSFVEDLRAVLYAVEESRLPHWQTCQNLDRYHIQVVDDVHGGGPLNPGR